MATPEKIKLAELQIDVKDILESQAELKERIRETTQATAQLEAQQKSLRAEGQASSDAYKDNAKQIELNKTVIGGLTREYRDNATVLASMATLNNDSAGTLEKLTARNKELRQMLQGLNLDTAEGKKLQKEYITEIDKNTKFIKDNSDAYVQQKMNIGNYKSALDALPPSLKSGVDGFKGMTQAAKAFLLNPLALAITAIVGAVTALFKAFKSTEEGGDRLKKKFDQIKAAVSVVTDRIADFALGLAKVFSGEQKLKDLKGTFAGIGDEIQREVKLAGELRDMMEQLENAEIDLTVASADRRAEINKLREAAADQNKTEGERITLLQRAQRLMNEEADAQQKILLSKIANELGTTDLAKAQERLNQVREEGKQITLDEIGLSNSTNEDRQRVNDLIAQYIDLEGQAASQKKEISAQISGFIKQERTEREQQIEAENEALGNYYAAQLAAAEAEMLAEIELEKQKLAEKERLRQEDAEKQKVWDEDLRTFRQEKALLDAENERIAREVAMNDRFAAELDALKREQDAEIEAALQTGASVSLIMKKFAAIEKQIEREKQLAKLDILGSFIGSLAANFKEESKLAKAAAITQTVINTYKGAMAAFAETPGGVVIKSLAAGTAIATGIAAVRNILKVKEEGSTSAAISGDFRSVAGTGGSPSDSGMSTSFTPTSPPPQVQTVLVIEDFQAVEAQRIQVKQSGEL
jgi:hypothetical protein